VLRKGLKSASQIKTFGYIAGTSQFAAIKYLQSKGVNPSKVKMVSGGAPDTLLSLLQRGDIDGFVLWEPWPQKAQAEAIGRIVENSSAFGFSFQNWLISSSTWLGQNKATVQKIVKVLAQAEQQIAANPKVAEGPTDQAADLTPAATLQAVKLVTWKIRPLNSATLSSSETIARFFVKINAISKLPNLKAGLVLNWSGLD
jgi:NitT/TauT family transport system substrate-binding protein